ncbi:MAG: hypothetical protein Q8O25_17105 [Sulfurisoma sp.]|nr:hypothetical protein [Sulfurisoma sp.]
MQAIEFEAIARQHAIPIPASACVGEGQHVRVLLLVDDVKPAPAPAAGSDEVFRLLTELSDDFMAEGRQQPPLQMREGF